MGKRKTASQHEVQRNENGLISANGVYFYYIRNEKNQRIACVAFKRDSTPDGAAGKEKQGATGQINRGISICSTSDSFSRASARNKAYKNLRIAEEYGNHGNWPPVNHRGEIIDHSLGSRKTDGGYPSQIAFTTATNGSLPFKIDWQTQPTEYEAKILEGEKDRK